MRLIRFEGDDGVVRWGVERVEGLAEVVAGDPFGGPEPTSEVRRVVRRLAPVVAANIYCIGLNYRAHGAETGAAIPARPVVFMKPTTTVTDPGRPIRIPAACDEGPEVDYEGELAVVIGRAVRDVRPERALAAVAGYTCANDVSARRWQKERGGGQWIRGKSFDTFCPLGPVLVTPDSLPGGAGDPQALRIRTTLDGQVVQDGTTADMIFSVAELIAFLSRDTTLLPGTVILTGTPPGVGVARTPPLFLAPDQRVVVEIEGLGRLENPVVGPADHG
jgi:2-keto-4-pentenoate hydratase/2-oxohepta-3-ene-1,7-dioic acid hydratase in catechol pathway